MSHTSIEPGFIALHSNQSESLAQTVVSWIQAHPLNPLEVEVFLAQSNGMAEWLKMELARMSGVCAATQVELPARFLWRTYRQVLGRGAVPADSPLDKIPMTWRIMQLLPGLIHDPAFAPVNGFLKDDEPDRMLQLATRLADQFDQYQIYRTDWLEDWANGRDHLTTVHGTTLKIPTDQLWQPKLWRAILSTLDTASKEVIRPRLHGRVLQRLESGEPLAGRVARRVVVFCVSQFPLSNLQALAALSRHSQVILAVFNPCRFYWGDIIAGRELLQAQRRRQPSRQGPDLGALPLEAMHAHANPLLASWGRQGRDFIRQLDEFDDAEQTRRQFQSLRIDLFDESVSVTDTLLKQVQNQIRDLDPAVQADSIIASTDRSIVFHVAHSLVRELEVLHDQLLGYFASPPDQQALEPRDIVVMVPDIEQMAPAIRAVFGQLKRHDKRYIPFDISDLGAKSDSPLINAVEWLLRLPQQRCRMSELVDLLEVPAIAKTFGIEQDALPRLTRWMTGAGIRWGLNQAQRADLQLDACGDQNSAWFGLQRMLLGYCSGAGEANAGTHSFDGIDPYPEVGGLDAELAGALSHLLHALTRWWLVAKTPASPKEWARRGRVLLTEMVRPADETDRQALNALGEALGTWQDACEQAGFIDHVPLVVARSSWMDALNAPTLSRRFRAGGVTFCSLMPMRVVPFEVVCLLGMNDGDYPRASVRNDFDLMAQQSTGRPGDRSRREDDRQLMLEALLSARRVLYVSWCGRSVRDNSEQPPSVLVAQLRDYLCSVFGKAVVDARTTHHPLQPFSRRYFESDTDLLTYVREWRVAHDHATDDQESWVAGAVLAGQGMRLPPFVPVPGLPLTMAQLTTFLRNPVKAFFRHRLSVVFDEDEQENVDDESFDVAGLERYALIRELLEACPATLAAGGVDDYVTRALAQVRQAGRLPIKAMGDLTERELFNVIATMLHSWVDLQAGFGPPADRQSLTVEHAGLALEDWLDHLRQPNAMQSDEQQAPLHDVVWLDLEPGKLCQNTAAKDLLPRYDKLLNIWVRSLLSGACGVRALGVVVAQDVVLTIAPMPQELARSMLGGLLDLWLSGMNAPLPLPPRTAIATVQASKSPAEQYEGGERLHGEVEEPCLARLFPDYESLQSDGRLVALAGLIYKPFLQWATDCVQLTVQPSLRSDATAGSSSSGQSGQGEQA